MPTSVHWGSTTQGLERRYAYDALGQLTDTLDVYLDGTDLLQSGQSVIYNAFGEVVEERRKWGPASQSLDGAEYRHGGLVSLRQRGPRVREGGRRRPDRLLLQPAGSGHPRGEARQLGRPDDTGKRITETQYDVLGRAIMVRRPAFDADITPGTGTTSRLVTPYARRTLDRWGNLGGSRGGRLRICQWPAGFRSQFALFRSYQYDDNNQRIAEYLGTHEFVSRRAAS